MNEPPWFWGVLFQSQVGPRMLVVIGRKDVSFVLFSALIEVDRKSAEKAPTSVVSASEILAEEARKRQATMGFSRSGFSLRHPGFWNSSYRWALLRRARQTNWKDWTFCPKRTGKWRQRHHLWKEARSPVRSRSDPMCRTSTLW